MTGAAGMTGANTKARDLSRSHGPGVAAGASRAGATECGIAYAENELPQPQPPVAFGFLNVNPDPCMLVT